jgi:hypothetical protein
VGFLRWLGYLSGGLSLLRLSQHALAFEFHVVIASLAGAYHSIAAPIGEVANGVLRGAAAAFGYVPPPVPTDLVVLYLLSAAAVLRAGIWIDRDVEDDGWVGWAFTAAAWVLFPVVWPLFAAVMLLRGTWRRGALLREAGRVILAFVVFLGLNAGLVAVT